MGMMGYDGVEMGVEVVVRVGLEILMGMAYILGLGVEVVMWG